MSDKDESEDATASLIAGLLALAFGVFVNLCTVWLFLSFTCSAIKSLNHECDKKYVIETYFRLEGDFFCVKP